MIKFRQLFCGSDCTGPYKIEISKPMTVGEFIDEFIRTYPSEWGYIGINKPGKIFGSPKCEYNHGKLLTLLPDEYFDKEIIDVKGSGGWTRSDFILYVEES